MRRERSALDGSPYGNFSPVAGEVLNDEPPSLDVKRAAIAARFHSSH